MKIVPSEWPSKEKHRIAFIGEAPGFEETVKGRPFVGPSGAIFNAALRSANIERSDHYVGNVFSQEGTREEIDIRMRNPEEYELELRRLEEEMRVVEPNVIVPLGSTALWAFTGHGGITDYRGAVQPAHRVAPGAKLLPTYHPQAVQKQWKLLAVFVGDLMKAATEAARGPEIVYPQVTLHLDPTYYEAQDWLQNLHEASCLSVDIETGWGQITMIAFSPYPYTDSYCIPFVDFRKAHRSYWPTATQEIFLWEGIKRLMESPIPKLGQNFTYDAYWLWKRMGIKSMNYREDTRLMHHAMFPELEKSLAFMGARYTDIGAWKQWGGNASKEKRDDT